MPLRRANLANHFESTQESVYSLTRSHDRKLKKMAASMAGSQRITLQTGDDYRRTLQSPSMGDVNDI